MPRSCSAAAALLVPDRVLELKEMEPAAAEATPLCPASPLCPLCPATPLCPAMLRPYREDTCCDDDDAVCSTSALLEPDLDPTPFDDDPFAALL